MSLFANIVDRLRGAEVDWEELEETLIGGDLGIQLTTEIVDELQATKSLKTGEDVMSACRQRIETIIGTSPPQLPTAKTNGLPTVILVAGVNGVGKTTSVAKLASFLKSKGSSVVLAAADTFRAAAIEQLKIWADRIDAPIAMSQYQGDPSAVCFDAHQKAIALNADYLICDTAGRLHTRHNLMEELKKISRTLSKQDPDAPHENWIVVDATTGSNALSQAREFGAALNLTGMIVTKLDGSGKGGGVVAIQHELDVPTRFIGIGERAEDFAPFDPEFFLNSLL
ncbi:MAG: signal recognition particle-docking protein FtsY [Verrucomicrobiota bacterium]